MRAFGAIAACVGMLALGSGTAFARVVGNGTARSCTSAAVVAAVRAGGQVRFACGTKPVTIVLRATAKVLNTRPELVLDGGGRVTLSGGGKRRILYMNTCDLAQKFTTSHCQDQAAPRLTVQDMTFGAGTPRRTLDGGGGGAIFARGGRLRIVSPRFINNRCDREGPDVGGGAVRVSPSTTAAVDVVASRFARNVCSNGGALSSIGVSWNIVDSVFSDNRAIGHGANPARPAPRAAAAAARSTTTATEFALKLTGSRLRGNHANEGGGAIFFVSNDRTGTLAIAGSRLEHNPSMGFETAACLGSSSWAPERRRLPTASFAERHGVAGDLLGERERCVEQLLGRRDAV